MVPSALAEHAILDKALISHNVEIFPLKAGSKRKSSQRQTSF